MNRSINIIAKDGQVWNIHRSVIERLSLKPEAEVEAFFARFFAWFDPWEKDVLLSLVRMEKEGFAIESNINLEFNR